MSNQLISIITVVYNGAFTLEQTILSVINQTYKNIEYIIIDGGSTDGTVDIIKKYEPHLACWVSEPDKGIYDAMNKGIDKATGEWINFMNSGDWFYDNNVITLFESNINNCDILYGATIAFQRRKSIYCKAQEIIKIKKNMPCCHQSVFCKSNILKKHMFDLRYLICADYNLLYILYKNNAKFKKIDNIISCFEATHGVSSMNKNKLIEEVSKISGRNLFMVRIEYFLRDLKNRITCLK
ncbi:MAG: glycosyltransferase [Bacteroidales bacterium]|jgi:glycosyltransferase involved in cell wall biosynthesis|nr:glycosyltransferase [Bacteroidales bacterium]